MEKIVFERIVSKRNAKGLSKADLARACEITPTAYANIEKGDMNSISLDVAKGIAKALDENFNELFDIEISDVSKGLNKEIDQLKKRIAELDEQLNDKRRIIEFLSKNNLLLSTANQLYKNTNPIPIKRDFNDLDSLIKELKARPYDPGNTKSLIEYIQKHFLGLDQGTPE